MRVWRASNSVKPGRFGSRGLATLGDAGRRSRGFRILTVAAVAAALGSLGWVAFVFAAPVFQTGPGVTVEPSEVYTGDSIKITLDGLTPGYLIPGGSATLAGVRLAIPGVFGAAGVQPITDAAGEVSFTTKVPLETPYGPSELLVSNLGVGGSRATAVNVLAAEIELSPTSASPNETVTLRGLGFSPSTSPGGNGPLGVHQITGLGKSGVKLNGKLLGAPYVRYPIDLDSDGGLTTNFTVPESYVTAPGVGFMLKVIDDAGRSGQGPWKVKNRIITVYPTESGRGGKITVTGSGFAGTSRGNGLCVSVEISYGSKVIGKALPDDTGSFSSVVWAPITPGLSTTNTVSAATPGCPMVAAATANHKISPRSLKISPSSSVKGGRVTITGVSYVGYTPISVMTIGGISVLPAPAPFVDAGGSFSVDVAVPMLDAGFQTVSITAGNIQTTTYLVVTALPKATATPTPTPTAIPTPAATATPAPTATPTLVPLPTATAAPVPSAAPTATPAPQAGALLAPLGDNLLVVWSYNGNGQSWRYFSPNPGLTSDNQLATLVTDKLYWIRVTKDQSVLLNGRQRNITAGWSLIHW